MSANVSSIGSGDEMAGARRGTLAAACRLWAEVSLAGIGGSALQIATMRRLLVDGKQWISERRFYHALGYCIALPGPETQQLAVYGWLGHRTIGAVIAGGLFILPGLICMMALSFGYVTGASSRIAHAVFFGVKPAVLAVMIAATLNFARYVIRDRWMLAVAALAFAAAFVQVAFPVIVLGAGALGAFTEFAGWRSPRADPFANRSSERLPAHTRPGIGPFLRSSIVWLSLWLAPVAALLAIFGAQNVYTHIAMVFGKVAMMAIAGDYGVTVTQFLGFMTAYRDPGTLSPLIAGICGGLLATWMTFIPCFLVIMLAAPFIDGLRHNALLNSALNAVTAAAVGMIANLTVWFGIRTLFHQIDQYPPHRP